jgi:hypothetical protein
MFQLDDQFLKDIGLDEMPEEQRQAFLEHIYGELELRVGVKLSEGLSEEQLAEFESFVDRNDERDRAWVAAHAPGYLSDPSYLQLKRTAEEALRQANRPTEQLDFLALLAEYASLKWLGINRPNYREVVAQVLEELKREIIGSRDTLLGTDMPQAA